MEIGPGVGKNGEVRGYCCEEMFKKFYQWMVDFYLGYYGEQEDEKVFLQYIVIYNLLQKMVVVDIGYYREQVDFKTNLQRKAFDVEAN